MKFDVETLAPRIFTKEFRIYLTQVVKLIDKKKCEDLQLEIMELLKKQKAPDGVFSVMNLLLMILSSTNYLKLMDGAKKDFK